MRTLGQGAEEPVAGEQLLEHVSHSTLKSILLQLSSISSLTSTVTNMHGADLHSFEGIKQLQWLQQGQSCQCTIQKPWLICHIRWCTRVQT